ncbi:hypothetical protein [Streptomyces anulatus]|uniref:hypothetical protein n=1 Tax=Streptomyces anulatus TaxID=1892 RepID=UPI0038263466
MLDDALDAQQVLPLLASGPGSTVIVSSRRRLAGLDATGRISLEPLPDRDGLRLLGSLVGTDRVQREPDTAREHVRLCDGCRSPCGSRGSGSRHGPSGPWRTWWAEWPTPSLLARTAGGEDRGDPRDLGTSRPSAPHDLATSENCPRSAADSADPR